MSEETFETKDYWAIIALLVSDNVPIEIDPKVFNETGKCQLTYIFKKEAEEHYNNWMLGGELGSDQDVLITTRKVRDAIESFKYNLHRFSPK